MSANAPRQLSSLDGWRAVSILLVLGAHLSLTAGITAPYGAWADRFIDGRLGVRCFFTISGFLITWLLLREEREFGAVSLKNFYIRRALRILPVYLACLGVLALAQATGFADQTRVVWLQLLTFTRNFHQSGHLDPAVSGHFWSLAVEEQFYFFWPVFLGLVRSMRARIGLLIAMILFSMGCKLVALLGGYNRHLFFLFQEDSTLVVADCLAYGCLGAILLAARPEALKLFFTKFSTPIFLLGCLLLLVPEMAGMGIGLQSLGFAFLLLQSVLLPQFGPFRFLNHRWLVAIGVWSYSIYVWQQLVYVWWPFPRFWLLALPATFVVGWLSYHILEKPFLSLRSKFRMHRDA